MKQAETSQIDKRYKQTPHAVGWAGPPWFAPAVGVLTVCVLQKPRLPPGEGCSSESKNSLNKNDTPKDADVQTDRAPYLLWKHLKN